MPNKLFLLKVRLKSSFFRMYQYSRFKLAPGWREAKVDDNVAHIKIVFDTDSVLAVVGPDKRKDRVLIEFKQPMDNAELKNHIVTQRNLLNAMFSRDMPMESRWQYAMYHCGTTSNAYSQINTGVFWTLSEN